MDVILLCLQNPNDIENIICRIKDVLYILERLTPCRMSEKIQILSLLLKEIVRKLVCPSQTLEGNRVFFFFFSFTKKFINWIKLGFFFFFPSFRSRRFLRIVRHLANQDDTEPRKQLYSGLEREKVEILPFSQDMQILQRRYRRNQSTMGTYIRIVSRSKKFIFNPLLIRIDCFSASLISRTSQGTFCCEEAFKFNNIRIEWVLRQSISVSLTISLLPFRYDSFEIRALFRRHLGILSHTYTLF